MPLFIDRSLPAVMRLSDEGHSIFPKEDAPVNVLRIAIINLMPIKPDTEYDFLQLMADDPHPLQPIFIETATHRSKHTPAEHLEKYYTTFNHIDPQQIDGVIITGAPLEGVRFEDVDYWSEITEIFETIRQRHIPALFICWAAFAAMYHHYGINWTILTRKISGVFPHRIQSEKCPLLTGVSEGFMIPHSRFATWARDELIGDDRFRIAAEGDEQGVYMIESLENSEYYICGHGEYSTMTLDTEYRRDTARGLEPHIPDHYYPNDDPSEQPVGQWHGTALKMMANWINIVDLKHRQND